MDPDIPTVGQPFLFTATAGSWTQVPLSSRAEGAIGGDLCNPTSNGTILLFALSALAPVGTPSPATATGYLTPGQAGIGSDLAYATNIWVAPVTGTSTLLFADITANSPLGLIYTGGTVPLRPWQGVQTQPPSNFATVDWYLPNGARAVWVNVAGTCTIGLLDSFGTLQEYVINGLSVFQVLAVGPITIKSPGGGSSPGLPSTAAGIAVIV